MNNTNLSTLAGIISAYTVVLSLLVVLNLDLATFDDFKNYQVIYEKIHSKGFLELASIYREKGLVYIFSPLAYLGIDFEVAVKLVFITFVLFTLFLVMLFDGRNANVFLILIIFAFLVTNRQYIEGGFNYSRSWLAMHFFSWGLFVFIRSKGKKLPKFASFIFLACALLTHLQSTLIMICIIISPLILNKILLKLEYKILLLFVIYNGMVYLLENSILGTTIHELNQNTTLVEEMGFSFSLLYQTVVPFLLCLFLAYFVYVKQKIGSSEGCESSILFLSSIGLFFISFYSIIPLSIRFSCFMLLFVFLFHRNLFMQNRTATLVVCSFTLMNLYQLYNSSIWNVL